MSNSASTPDIPPTNNHNAIQGLLLKVPENMNKIGKKMNKLASIFKELDSVYKTNSRVHTFEQDCYKNLSALFDILGKNFDTLNDTLKDSYKSSFNSTDVLTIDTEKKATKENIELSNIYRVSIEAFKSFFSTGNTEICTLEYDTVRTEDERIRLYEERLEEACKVIQSIQKQVTSYLDTINKFKNSLISLRDSFKKPESSGYIFFNDLLMFADIMNNIYNKLSESLGALIPQPLDYKAVNIVELTTKLDEAIDKFIYSFKNIYIEFVEDYASKSQIFRRYSDEATFNIFDKYFKSPNANITTIFNLLNRLCECTSGEAKKKADLTLSKMRNCINRIKSAFEYSYRIEKMLDFKKTIEDYKPEEKFILDGTRELVGEWKSVSFTVTGKLPLSKFDTKKPISSKIYMFNNGLLLCPSRPKECKFIDFKDVDVTFDKDSLKLTHESTEWNITISNLGRQYEDFKDKVSKLVAAAKEKRVFGTDLKTLSTKSKSSRPYIPSVIDQVIQYLLLPEPIKTEGILRKAANEKILDKYVQATDNGYQVHFNDPHAAAGFLKRWIRNIPGSLLMDSKIKEWKEADSDPAKLVKVFESLEEQNKAIFRELLNLSCRIMAEESSNLMNKDAILTCLQMIVLEDRYVSNTILSVFLDDPNLIGVNIDQPNRPNIGIVNPVKPNPNFIELHKGQFKINGNGNGKHNRVGSSYNTSGSSSSSSTQDTRNPSYNVGPPSPLLPRSKQPSNYNFSTPQHPSSGFNSRTSVPKFSTPQPSNSNINNKYGSPYSFNNPFKPNFPPPPPK